MAKTSILLKMGLDTSKMKASLEKAKAGVKDFSTNAKTGLDSLKKSFGGITGIIKGSVVGGFVAAAKSAMSYATEIDRMARLSGEGVEKFQELAAGARMVGIDSGKLADILKDTSDKMGDFLEADSGAAIDFFENIAGGADLTRESFENLSGSESLQLYYSALEKANLSHSKMVFYMEAIGNDAILLQDVLKNGGALWKQYAKEAREAGRIMSEETAKELKRAQVELENLGETGTISIGRLVKAMSEVDNEDLLRFPYAMTMALYDEFYAEVDEKKTESTEKAKTLIKTETEALRKANEKRIKLQEELDKNSEKIAAEKQKRDALEQTSMEALIAAELKRLTAYEDFQEAVASGNKEEASKKEVAYAEALTAEAIARKKVKEELAAIDKNIADSLKTGSELSAKIAMDTFERRKEEKLLSEQVRLQAELKEAIASGSLDAVKAAQDALDVEEQIVQTIRDHNVTRDQAVAHVKALRAEEQVLINEKEAAAAKEEAAAARILAMEQDLLMARANGNDALAREIQGRIDKEKEALAIMDQFGISIEKARAIAEKLAAINAGPDLNQSGFTTPKEQREFDRIQAERQKEQDEINDQELRDERQRGRSIPNVSDTRRRTGTIAERMAESKEKAARINANRAINKEGDEGKRKEMIAAEEVRRAAVAKANAEKFGGDQVDKPMTNLERQAAKNKALQDRRDAEEKAKNQPLGPDGKPILPGGNHVGPDGKVVGPNGEPLDPNGKPVPDGPKQPGGGKDPSLEKLDKIIAELQTANKSLTC